MTVQTPRPPDWYRRLLAWGMAKANTADDTTIQLRGCSLYPTLAQLKQALFADLQGEVLEIGPGAGANLAYYPPDIHWLGVELNPFMYPYLQLEAERLGLSHYAVQSGSAEQLPVADNSQDAVVSTYVLCSVTDLSAVLGEILRVLKPGGRFIFIEHVAAECGTWTRRVQGGVQPAWKVVFDGCHPARETWKDLENAGFANVDYQHFQLSIPVVSPHIAGVATK